MQDVGDSEAIRVAADVGLKIQADSVNGGGEGVQHNEHQGAEREPVVETGEKREDYGNVE